LAYRPAQANIHLARMFFDAIHHALGQSEGSLTLQPAHQRRAPGTDRFDKSLKF
jgi:hypothetical protein